MPYDAASISLRAILPPAWASLPSLKELTDSYFRIWLTDYFSTRITVRSTRLQVTSPRVLFALRSHINTHSIHVYVYLWSRLRGTAGVETSSPLVLEVLRLALLGLGPSTSGKTSFELQIIRVALTLEIIWTSTNDRCISGELQQHRSLYF